MATTVDTTLSLFANDWQEPNSPADAPPQKLATPAASPFYISTVSTRASGIQPLTALLHEAERALAPRDPALARLVQRLSLLLLKDLRVAFEAVNQATDALEKLGVDVDRVNIGPGAMMHAKRMLGCHEEAKLLAQSHKQSVASADVNEDVETEQPSQTGYG